MLILLFYYIHKINQLLLRNCVNRKRCGSAEGFCGSSFESFKASRFFATSINFIAIMSTRSPPRGRPRSRSPYSEASRPDSRSPSRPRRSITPRSPSHSPRRNGRYRSESRSLSRSRSRSPARSPIRSTKVRIAQKKNCVQTKANLERSSLRNSPRTSTSSISARSSATMARSEIWICQ